MMHQETTVMDSLRTLRIADEDMMQVYSCLMTHAEIQDQRAMTSEELIGRLKRDEPVEAADLIHDLEDQVQDFEEDSENLKRIANLFHQGA